MKSSDNKKLTYIVVAMCFMLLVFGVSIGYNLTRNNRNYSGIDEPKLGDTSVSVGVGKTKQITATAAPTSDCPEYGSGDEKCYITWSAGSNVVSVPSNSFSRTVTITGNSAGSTTITARTFYQEEGEGSIVKTETWNVTVTNEITSCDPGEYLSGGSCHTCETGYYCTGGTSAPKSCSDATSISGGTTAYIYSQSGSSSISSCYATLYGTEIVTAYAQPSACPKGTYQETRYVNYGSSGSCVSCPTGTTTSGTGATSSSACVSETTSVTSISIDECSSGSTTMVVGETKSFNTTITPSNATNKAVRWSTTADEDQLSILETGSVTAISVGGPYTITATARDGSGKTATCSITVSNPATYVESVSLNKSSITLTAGESTTVTATVLPSNASNKTISWSSGSVAIARVSNGTITGVAPGTTTITARATDGSNKSASVSVTVVAAATLDKIYVNGRDDEVYYLALPVSSSDTDGSIMTAGLTAINTLNVGIEEGITWTVERTSGSTATAVINSDAVVFTATGQASSTTQMLKNVFRVTGTYNGVSKTQDVTVWIYCPWTKTNYLNSNGDLTSKIEVDTSKYTSRMGKRFESGCTAYEGNKVVDGKSYYTARYDRCCGTSGGGTTTKTSACYANAATIEEATQAEWLTEATSTLKYKLSGVTEGNCLPYACYGNASTIENSTNVGWYNYQPSGYYKLSASRSSCVKVEEACYGNGQTIATSTHVVWTSTKPNGYYKLSGVDKTSCVINTEPSLCYMNTSTGEYVWGKYQTTLGYEFVPAVTVEDYCKKPAPELNFACYKDSNGLYYWGDYSGDSGYTLISGITDSTKCGDPQEDACYKNGNEYVWGTYANVTGYELITSINSASLCQNEACYKNNTSGNYEWGKHANDDNYTLVSNLTNKDACNNDIDVPQTAANVETIIYVGIAVLVMAGLTFMYYAFNNKHEY